MIVDTDILFKEINNKLIELNINNKLNNDSDCEYNDDITNKIRYYRELKTGLLRLETFATTEKLDYFVI